MATSYTSLLGLALPANGDTNWGTTINDSMTTLVDSAVAGTTTLSSDADVTLTTTTGTANQSRQPIILWTAGGTATRYITAPAASKPYIVINKTSSTQSIVLRGVGPTTGITIVANEACVAAWNGTDFVKVSTSSAASVTGNNAFTGANTFYNSTGQTFGTATSTQDGIVLAGRAGGSSSYRSTIQPGTLSANRTITLPDNTGTVLTTGAAVTVGQGGTGQTSSLTQYGVIYGSTTTAMASTAAGTSTQVLHGNASGAPTWSAVSLSADVTGTLPIANGGTGQTTANAAFNALAPSQGGNSGKYLKTDGSNTSWDAVDISTADITGTLSIANGGTGQTTATEAFDSLSPTTTLGDIIYRGASDNLRLAGNTTTTKNFLSQTGTGSVSAAPAWSTVTKSDVGLSNVENTALSTWAGSSSITTVGTLTALTVSTTATISGVFSGLNVSNSFGPNTGTSTGTTKLDLQGRTGWPTISTTRLAHIPGAGLYASDFQIQEQTGASTFTTHIWLLSGGNFGVGVSPSYKLDVNGTARFSGGAATPPVAVTFSATAMTVNCALSNVFTTTFTANVTTAPTLSSPQDGQTINWFITQDGTGGRTMTWPTSFKWPGGTAGVLSTGANAVDLVTATYRSATGFWYATLLKAFS